MNVVWFVLDTLRADHLGCYGYFRNTSPNIDRLAKEGFVFENSYASSIATGPGFTSLITGLAAINHGFYLTPWDVPNEALLDDRIPTLAECIQARGPYTTAAFDNLINFRSHMKQFVRGFEFYTNITRSPAWVHHHVLAGEVNHRLLPWLEHHAGEPFFAFVHYWDPHTPYNMPKEFAGTFKRDRGDLTTRVAPDGYEYVPGWGRADRLPADDEHFRIDWYDDEILYTDYCIGQVREKLDALNLLDDTVIIVTSDHGEDLDQHGLWGHATVHETTVQVPLVIRDPRRVAQAKRVTGFAQHADNLPTILEYFPVQDRPNFDRIAEAPWLPIAPDKCDGINLLPALESGTTGRDEIVVETGAQRAYLAPPWKLIWDKENGAVELFHLGNDPLELTDRSSDEPAKTAELSEKLRHWVALNLNGERSDPILATGGAWTCFIGKRGER